VSELGAEDAKLVLLARAARTRAYVPHGHGRVEGAAVRDTDGRTYTAATIEHANSQLCTSALRGALSAAASSGARTFEAAVIVGEATVPHHHDLAMLSEFGEGVPLTLADPSGEVVARLLS
jgi:cytidine deaminase